MSTPITHRRPKHPKNPMTPTDEPKRKHMHTANKDRLWGVLDISLSI